MASRSALQARDHRVTPSAASVSADALSLWRTLMVANVLAFGVRWASYTAHTQRTQVVANDDASGAAVCVVEEEALPGTDECVELTGEA